VKKLLKSIKWYHYIFLWLIPVRKTIDIDKKTGTLTEIYYKYVGGKFYIYKERFIKTTENKELNEK